MNIDLLFTNANVLTLDNNNRRAGSVSVSGGRIVGIWPEPEPSINGVNITDQTEVINLQGNTLLPGFIDTHNHILMYSQNQSQVDCSSPPHKTIADIKEAIGLKAKNTDDGKWVVGMAMTIRFYMNSDT